MKMHPCCGHGHKWIVTTVGGGGVGGTMVVQRAFVWSRCRFARCSGCRNLVIAKQDHCGEHVPDVSEIPDPWPPTLYTEAFLSIFGPTL